MQKRVVSLLSNDTLKAAGERLEEPYIWQSLSAKKYNPAIKKFADRLKENGKAPKVILIAVARKLIIMIDAMIKNNTSWNKNYA